MRGNYQRLPSGGAIVAPFLHPSLHPFSSPGGLLVRDADDECVPSDLPVMAFLGLIQPSVIDEGTHVVQDGSTAVAGHAHERWKARSDVVNPALKARVLVEGFSYRDGPSRKISGFYLSEPCSRWYTHKRYSLSVVLGPSPLAVEDFLLAPPDLFTGGAFTCYVNAPVQGSAERLRP